MPVNFANGKVYAIRSHQTDKVYIGSTTQTLAQRFGKHKKCLRTMSREIMKFDDCYIELLQEFACNNKMQLNKKEGEYIRSMNCINKRIEGRTLAEHYQDNKQEILEKNKQYREMNKEQITEHNKKPNTCDCGGKYTTQNKQQHFKTPNHKEFIRQLSA
jgi:hypothetical protein